MTHKVRMGSCPLLGRGQPSVPGQGAGSTAQTMTTALKDSHFKSRVVFSRHDGASKDLVGRGNNTVWTDGLCKVTQKSPLERTFTGSRTGPGQKTGHRPTAASATKYNDLSFVLMEDKEI